HARMGAPMNRSVRSIATALAVGFAVYFAAGAAWWIVQPTAPLIMVAAILLCLTVMLATVLMETSGGIRMPLWWGVVAVVTSCVIPTMVSASLQPMHRTEPFATWYIGALGLLAVVCIVRRRPIAGWLVLLVLTVSAAVHL